MTLWYLSPSSGSHGVRWHNVNVTLRNRYDCCGVRLKFLQSSGEVSVRLRQIVSLLRFVLTVCKNLWDTQKSCHLLNSVVYFLQKYVA